MKLLWFIPTHGDGRYLGTSYGGRPLNFGYLKQIACAVDNLGFYGALLPTGRSCEDAWVAASSLISETHRMRFLLAVRPGLISPSLAARMTATFDRLSNGRLLINVVTGGDPVELAGDGVFLEHDDRYEITDEFLEIWRALLSGAGEVNYEGKYLQVKGAENLFRGIQQPYPALYFGGSSDVGVAVAAKHIDYYITWGEPPAQVATKIETVREEVARWGRLVRGGAGTALVGSAETVAARMLEYRELGIETFILSGYPHLEEAFRVAELLFDRLPLTHDASDSRATKNPSFPGEIVGNDLLPRSPVGTS